MLIFAQKTLAKVANIQNTQYICPQKLQNINYVVQFIFSLFYRLVTSDVAFYSGTYKTLRGLEHLTNHMSDLWNGL
jgi:hypothetical protein